MLKTLAYLWLITTTFSNIVYANEDIDLLSAEQEPQMQCSIFGSKQWEAHLEESKNNVNVLKINAEATLPTPGYKIEWKSQLNEDDDKSHLVIELSTTPPDGIVIQLLTQTPINIQMETTHKTFASITILCGDKELSILKNIKIKD